MAYVPTVLPCQFLNMLQVDVNALKKVWKLGFYTVCLRTLHSYETGIAWSLRRLMEGEQWKIPLNAREFLHEAAMERHRSKTQAVNTEQTNSHDNGHLDGDSLPAPLSHSKTMTSGEMDTGTDAEDTESLLPIELDEDQVRAAEMICANPVTVISGKGGCGKTTVVSLLFKAVIRSEEEEIAKACADFEDDIGGSQDWAEPQLSSSSQVEGEEIEKACADFKNDIGGSQDWPTPQLSSSSEGEVQEEEEGEKHVIQILLTAPTGRAASLLTKKTPLTAYTLHQVVCSFMKTTKHDNGRPKNWRFKCVRVLVVDEGSLVCVQLLNTVLSLLCRHARLCKFILLGDVRQLPSIQPGNTLCDLFQSSWAIEMRTNHRAESELIVRNAGLIADMGTKRTYRPLEFDAVVDLKIHHSIDLLQKRFIHICLPATKQAAADDLQSAVKYLIESGPGLDDDRLSQFITFKRSDVALINELCCIKYRRHTTRDHNNNLNLQVGDKVCCTRSRDINEEQRLCNGQIFFITKDVTQDEGETTEDGLTIMRPCRYLTLDDHSGFKITAKWEVLKECRLQHAWARTIHTFQGSETDTVVYVMGDSRAETWKHVYTAVTRGQKRVYVVAKQEAIASAIKRRETPRNTRLSGLVKEVLSRSTADRLDTASPPRLSSPSSSMSTSLLSQNPVASSSQTPITSTSLSSQTPITSTSLSSQTPITSTSLSSQTPITSTSLSSQTPFTSTSLLSQTPFTSTSLSSQNPITSTSLSSQTPSMATSLSSQTPSTSRDSCAHSSPGVPQSLWKAGEVKDEASDQSVNDDLVFYQAYSWSPMGSPEKQRESLEASRVLHEEPLACVTHTVSPGCPSNKRRHSDDNEGSPSKQLRHASRRALIRGPLLALKRKNGLRWTAVQRKKRPLKATLAKPPSPASVKVRNAGTLCAEVPTCDDDEGFCLSVPGQVVTVPPPPVRRRPVPSSSDSEMKMRLKEAAVSIKYLIPTPSSCQTNMPSSSVTEVQHPQKITHKDEERDVTRVRKKKKKKVLREEGEEVVEIKMKDKQEEEAPFRKNKKKREANQSEKGQVLRQQDTVSTENHTSPKEKQKKRKKSCQTNMPSSSVTEVQHPEKNRNKEEEERHETHVRKKKKKKVHREEGEEVVEIKTNDKQEEEAPFRKNKKKMEAKGEKGQVLRQLDTVNTEDHTSPKDKQKKRKKRKADAYSASEIEMRLKEAAVSIKYLIPTPSSCQTNMPSVTEVQHPEKIRHKEEEGDVTRVRKKKKKKVHQEESEEAVEIETNGKQEEEAPFRKNKKKRPPTPLRRRTVPSSSDSEMKMRLKEAAVSIKDLIPTPSSCQTNMPSSSVTEVQHPEKITHKDKERDETRVHKKKKKKVLREEGEEVVEIKMNDKQEEEAPFRKNKKKREENQGEKVFRPLDTVSTEDHTSPKDKQKKRKKRKADAYSASEIEMRLKEAAVSIKDLIPTPSSCQTNMPSVTEVQHPEKIRHKEEEGDVTCVRKKKKKRVHQEESEEAVEIETNDKQEEEAPFRKNKKKRPPTPLRRRTVPSSSDSEMKMRLKEAAVSIKDLIPTPSSCQTNMSSSSVTEVQHPEKITHKDKERDETRVRKKKKKKVLREEGEEVVEIKMNDKQEEEAPFRKNKKKREENQGEKGQVLRQQDSVNTEDHTSPKDKQKKRKKSCQTNMPVQHPEKNRNKEEERDETRVCKKKKKKVHREEGEEVVEIKMNDKQEEEAPFQKNKKKMEANQGEKGQVLRQQDTVSTEDQTSPKDKQKKRKKRKKRKN